MIGKCLLGVAVAGIGLTAGAQSNVQIWGRVGGGVEYLGGIKTGANSTASKLSQGSNWGTSILGIRGTEDLGGGTQAQFWLESAIASDTGAFGGGKAFQRGAWVALKNNNWGMIRLGQGNFINNYIWGFDPFLLEDYSASTFTNYRNGSKLANGLRYESPSWGGFEFAGQINLGESAKGFKQGPADDVVKNGLAWGVTAAYKQPTWEVRAIYDVINNADGKMDNLFVSSKELFLGGKMRFGPALLQGAWVRYTAPDTAPGLARRADHAWVGLTYDATSRLHLQSAIYTMKVGEGAGDQTHTGQGRGTMLALGGMYDLSKRTFLYATAAHVKNSSTANFSVRPTMGYTPSDPGVGNGTSPMMGRGQTGIFAGVMHNF